MPVVSVREDRKARESSQNNKWARTYKRVFIVITDDEFTGAGTVRASIGIGPNEIYKIPNANPPEIDSGAFVSNISAQCVADDGKQWNVTVEYSTFDPNQQKDPTLSPPEVSWDVARFQTTAEKDRNGNPIVNAAGMIFNPGLQRDQSRPVLRITRNEMQYDDTYAGQYRDKTNLHDFWGYGPNQVKCLKVSGSRSWNQDIGYYWPVVYEFEMNPDGWTRHVANVGTMQIVAGKLTPCVTERGLPVPDPVPLDGNGKQLSVGGTPNFLDFDIEGQIDFAGLNLDQLYQDILNYKYVPPT